MRPVAFFVFPILWPLSIAAATLYCSHQFGVYSLARLKNAALSVQVNRSDSRTNELLQCIRGPSFTYSGYVLSVNVGNYKCRQFLDKIAEFEYSYVIPTAELIFQCPYPGVTPCEQSPTTHHWAFDGISINRGGISFSYECQQEVQKKDEASATKKFNAEVQPPKGENNTPKPTKKPIPQRVTVPPIKKPIPQRVIVPPTKKPIPQRVIVPPARNPIPQRVTTTRPLLKSLTTSEPKRQAISAERDHNQAGGMSLTEKAIVVAHGVCLPMSSTVFAVISALSAVSVAVLFFIFGFCVGGLYNSAQSNVPASDAAHASSSTSVGQEHDAVAAVSGSHTHHKTAFTSILEKLFKGSQKRSALQTAIANDNNPEQQQQSSQANEALPSSDAQMQSNADAKKHLTAVINVTTADEKKGNDEEDINAYSDVNILKDSDVFAPRTRTKLPPK